MDMFDKLSQIDQSKTSWKVRVRVSRLWLSIGNNGGLIEACNLILIDEENYTIHAIIKPELWMNLANLIIEGNIYDVSHFLTKVASGRLRPVHSDLCIVFTISTIVMNVFEDNLTIPLHKFQLSHLRELRNILSSYAEDRSPVYSLDVIGVIQQLQSPTMIQTIYGATPLVRFMITDGRFSYKVNVWGEHDASNVDVLFEPGLETPVVAILASVRLCKFQGKGTALLDGVIELSSLPSTKIYTNLQNNEVVLFRQRLQEQGFEH